MKFILNSMPKKIWVTGGGVSNWLIGFLNIGKSGMIN
jgi:hypothetical protein